MPSPARERGRAARPRGSEEEFVLFLQGIPARCRWQELKDLVRQTALHIRQAVVYDDQHGFPTGLGQIIVKNGDEAWRTYHRLSTNGWEGQSLVVTLARTSSPTRPIAGPTKSPSCMIPLSYAAGYSTPPRAPQNMAIPPSPVSPEPVISTSPAYHGPDYGPVVSPMVVPHQPFIPVFFKDPLSQPVPCLPNSPGLLPNSPGLRPSFCDPTGFGIPQPHSLSMSHMHHQPLMANSVHLRPNNNTTSHNTPYSNHTMCPSNSTPRQHPRLTIFVQNLHPATTERELRSFLQEAGIITIEHCELPIDTDTDMQTSRCRGFARVTLRSAEEAKRAVALYNGTIFMGYKIRVRLDRSGTIPRTSYSLAPNINSNFYHNHSYVTVTDHAIPTASVCGIGSIPMQEPSLSSHSSPSTAGSSEPDECKLTPRCEENTRPKPIDRCQPLVVNGSGVGRRAAVAI